MSSRSRIARGRLTQRLLADYLRGCGWPDARSVEAFAPGRDIQDCAGLAIEVKATADVPLLGAIRQAEATAGGDIPFVVWRPNGRGPAQIGEWVVALHLDEFIELLKEAGYGTDG
jgi:hypothetical protein